MSPMPCSSRQPVSMPRPGDSAKTRWPVMGVGRWLFYSYNPAMSTYSVADAKNNLPRLIDQALQGEHVVITRHGNPVVELRPVQKTGRPMTAADVAWFRAHRVGKITPPLAAG